MSNLNWRLCIKCDHLHWTDVIEVDGEFTLLSKWFRQVIFWVLAMQGDMK